MPRRDFRKTIGFGAALAIAVLVPVLAAAEPQTFTAEASAAIAGGAPISRPLTLVVNRFATDAERDALMAAIKRGGSEAAHALLEKQKDAGSLKVGDTTVPIKYAYARTTGDGRLITAVAATPMAFLGPTAKSTIGYDLALAVLEVKTAGGGTGELTPAAKVKLNDQGAIVTEDHAPETVRLTNVVKKQGAK